MLPAVSLSLAAVAAYLIGSIPFGLLIAKYWHGIDVRQHGSGNIGATNVGRTIGKRWGIACLVLDALKGLVPTLLLPRLFPIPGEWLGLAAVVCGAAAIVGHIFPIWLGFRGGKGVATGAGVAVVLAWPAALAAVGAFAILFAAKRLVSLASIVAAIVYAVIVVATLDTPFGRQNLAKTLFSIAVPALIIIRHRENIGRIFRGEEKRFTVSGHSTKAAHPTDPKEPMANA